MLFLVYFICLITPWAVRSLFPTLGELPLMAVFDFLFAITSLPMFEALFLIPQGVAAALQEKIRQHGPPRRSQYHHHYHGLRLR